MFNPIQGFNEWSLCRCCHEKRSDSPTTAQKVAKDVFDFAALPPETKLHALRFVAARDLTAFGCASKESNTQNWIEYAKRIGCPLNESSTYHQQVVNFITNLKKQASNFIYRCPDEIIQILNKPVPTIDEINTLRNWLTARNDLLNWDLLLLALKREFPLYDLPETQEPHITIQQTLKIAQECHSWRTQNSAFLKARDALVIWETLAQEAGLPGPSSATLIDLESIITTAKEFDRWVDINQAALSQIKNLKLRHKNLTSIPDALFTLRQLKHLYLDYNQLTEIPTQLFDLRDLLGIDLSHNQITKIPKAISKLTELFEIKLSYNQITYIPIELNKISNFFYFLYLDHNQITEIPKELGDHPSLDFLNLKHNLISRVPKELANISTLTRLDLSDNYLTEVPKQLFWRLHGNLKSINLSNNYFSEHPSECPPYRRDAVQLAGNPLTFCSRASTWMKDTAISLTAYAMYPVFIGTFALADALSNLVLSSQPQPNEQDLDEVVHE